MVSPQHRRRQHVRVASVAIDGLFEKWVADSSYMTKDGSDNVSSWAGSYASRTLAQATGAQQPNWTSALAAANNKPAVQFTAANSDELNDAGTTDYNFAVRTDTGTGCTLTGCFYSTGSGGAPLMGIGADGTKARWLVSERSGVARYNVSFLNAAGTNAADMFFGPIASGVYWFAFARAQGTGTGLFTGDGSRNSGVAPVVTDGSGVSSNTVTPTRGVRLGRSGGTYTSPAWLEVSLYSRVLTAAEMSALGSYYVSTYGAVA